MSLDSALPESIVDCFCCGLQSSEGTRCSGRCEGPWAQRGLQCAEVEADTSRQVFTGLQLNHETGMLSLEALRIWRATAWF